jgi:Fe-S-cluster containining protein
LIPKKAATEKATAEQLAASARASISDYCSSECKAYCCRKGFLLLTASEVPLLHDTTQGELPPILLQDNEQGFVLDLKENGCKNLSHHKCLIHTNPSRPKACKDFPLFLWKDKTVMVTYACPAVKENKLYPFLAAFKSRGYTLIYSPAKD